MAFQIKSFLSITASMINYARGVTSKITDYTIGSVVRTTMESVAQELDELYQQMVHGLEEAIPVSVYNTFNFPPLPAITAGGLIHVTITPQATATVIAANSLFTDSSGVGFVSTADATIAIGNSYIDVPVSANEVGSAGNVQAGDSFTLSPQAAGFLAAVCVAGIQNGVDQETDDQRYLRFQQYVSTLQRGTLAAITYGLSTTTLTDSLGNIIEAVKYSSLVEPYKQDNTQPVGLVLGYVHNGVGGTSLELVGQAQQVTEGYYDAQGNAVLGWKAAGVHFIASAATEQPVNLSASLTSLPGIDETPLCTQAVALMSAYILSLGLGMTCKLAAIVAQVMALPGVSNFVFIGGPTDVQSAITVKLMPGTLLVVGSSVLTASLATSTTAAGTLT
jgi:hypothetical protein